ncbi:hypothetical protein SCB49_00797 [unidentified eubacterium SCB49]|nr:hypothetical protein SCB49_00797 [unidentified eubacterium SCB49]
MKIFNVLFLNYSLLLCNHSLIAQNSNTTFVLEKMQMYYNQAQYDSITSLFTEGFLQKVPTPALKNLFTELKRDLGKLESFTFQKQVDIVEIYTAHFTKGDLKTSIAINENLKIKGILFKPIETHTEPNFTRNKTAFILPFKGEWLTFWGGATKAQNYHVISKSQQGAFDFIIQDENNKSYQRSGTRNEDYYAFGKPIYAVCDAEVVAINTGVHDNPPGRMNTTEPFGNMITLKTAAEEYIVYAHFEQGTIKVKIGDQVKQGQYLANCGNSGNSSEPHLHFHLQDRANNIQAVGATSYFKNVIVNNSLKDEYSPVKFDIISRQD